MDKPWRNRFPEIHDHFGSLWIIQFVPESHLSHVHSSAMSQPPPCDTFPLPKKDLSYDWTLRQGAFGRETMKMAEALGATKSPPFDGFMHMKRGGGEKGWKWPVAGSLNCMQAIHSSFQKNRTVNHHSCSGRFSFDLSIPAWNLSHMPI